MDRDRKWERATVLILTAVAVFGIAEHSQNTPQIFNEIQEQTADTDLQAESVQADGNSGETGGKDASEQEPKSEDISEQETESGDILEQEPESEENVRVSYPLHEGMQCVCKDGKYGFFDSDGKTLIPFAYDDAAPLIEGFAYFSKGDTYGFMDQTGTPVFYLDCDSVSNFQEGLAYISVDGKYGYIDQGGETVIEPAYQDAGYFQDGCAIILKNGKYGVIDKTGKEMIEPKYQEMERGGENFVVREGGKYQILDRGGKALLKSPCQEVDNYYDPVVGFRDSEQGICGFAAGDYVYYFEEYYEWMAFIPQRELVILRKDESYGIKDFQGNTIKSFRYGDLYYNPDEDVFYVTNKGESSYNSQTITADDFIGRAMDEKVKEKYARGEELSKDLQYNKLTPRVPKYLEFLKKGTFSMVDFWGHSHDISLAEWAGDEITTRLYDLGQLGNPALYLKRTSGNVTFGGFFAVWGDEVSCLVTADWGGGSGGGETAYLWYDNGEEKLLPGRTNHYGGGVFGAGGEIYDFIDGECQEKISWEAFDHFAPGGEMLEPTFYVNGEEASEEDYSEVDRRYSIVNFL